MVRLDLQCTGNPRRRWDVRHSVCPSARGCVNQPLELQELQQLQELHVLQELQRRQPQVVLELLLLLVPATVP